MMQIVKPPAFDQLRRVAGMALACLVLGLAPRMAAAEDRTGEQVYRQTCASCHGAKGEGTPEDYPKPLVGDRSVAQLEKLIAKTMPADDPGSCTGEEARKVAAFIHEAFYSPTAQARNKPARIDLSRLTVRQYRHAVADLVGGFRDPVRWDDARGLRAEYYKSRRFRDNNRVIERTDPEVRFDFGEASPDPEKLEAHEFSIRWEGSVLAPETGEYEFLVRTDHATRLWINDLKKPLIDALVKSGADTEHKATIFLLGGRAYPLRLEFSKAKQGVDDSKKTKDKPPAVKASIALEWTLPRRTGEVVPQRNLIPKRTAETLVVTTPFPPDDRSIGYERGTSVSKEWDQATTDAAIEVSGYVAAHLNELAGARDEAPVRAFCRRFAERAFRRPLTDEQAALFVDRQFAEGRDLETAVRRVVLLVLKSPRFLYREVGPERPDAYDVAARLSFGLWDSLPDAPLLEAAASGRLATREQVAEQAERMVADPRARSKVRELLFQWLNVDQVADMAKDPRRFPEFKPAIVSDLRTSLDLFLDDVVWGESSDFRQILLADSVYLNGRLAPLYGADLPPDAPFQKVSAGSGVRAGVLTHPYLLANFAYTSTSSPIHRGVFLARGLLGRTLRPPPEAFAPLAADLHPQLTTRERVDLQTRPQSCQTCHAMINPLGFTLERYDAIGRYREQEQDRPIDATGAYQTRTGDTVTFAGARDLAAFLAGSEETHEAFVEQLFHALVKQPVRAYGPDTLANLRRNFADNGFHVRKLMVAIMAETALTARETPPLASTP